MSVTSVAIQVSLIDLLSRGASVIKNNLLGVARASKETQRSFDKMNVSFKRAALSAVATRQIYLGLKPAVGAAAELQTEMLGTRAELMNSGKDARQLNSEMAAIKKTAFSVQAWTPYDMGQIVAVQKELVKAGANVKDVVGESGAAAATSALAVYEKMDPTQAGKALIGIGTPFKIAADGYMELADNVSRAASASTVGAAEIAETAKYASGPMAALGKSSKEMLALSAVMAQVGITGSMAGTGIKNFFLKAADHKELTNANGSLKTTAEIIGVLREKLKGVGEADRISMLKKAFGEQGMPVALAMLNEEKGSYEEIVKAMESAASLQDKLNLSMKGFSRQLQSLGGTTKSTFAQLYQPALKPLTALIKKTNEFVAGVGKAAIGSESVGKTVSGMSLGALGAGALATIGSGAAGLLYLRKLKKGVGGFKGLLGGAGSTAAGVATGKALQAATGVQPVFVTNWPSGFGIGAGGASNLVGGKTGKYLTSAGGLLKKLPLLAGGKLLAAGAAGYGVGTLLNKGMGWLSGKMTDGKYSGSGWLGSWLYDQMHQKDNIKNDIKINLRVDEYGRVITETNDMNTKAELERGDFFAGPMAGAMM
jgi:TP901 family phage tail tape measure protein